MHDTNSQVTSTQTLLASRLPCLNPSGYHDLVAYARGSRDLIVANEKKNLSCCTPSRDVRGCTCNLDTAASRPGILITQGDCWSLPSASYPCRILCFVLSCSHRIRHLPAEDSKINPAAIVSPLSSLLPTITLVPFPKHKQVPPREPALWGGAWGNACRCAAVESYWAEQRMYSLYAGHSPSHHRPSTCPMRSTDRFLAGYKAAFLLIPSLIPR